MPNAGLTALGRRQADRVARRMLKLNPQASFSSNLPRAVETAERFALLSGQVVHRVSALAELDTGNIWAAPETTKTRIMAGDYEVDYKSLGGESVDEFTARVRVGLDQLTDTCTGLGVASVAAFLHEGVIAAILDLLDGFQTFEIRRRGPMPNGALITVDTDDAGPHYPGSWETGHLDGVAG